MVLLGLDSSLRVQLYFSEFDLDKVKKKRNLIKRIIKEVIIFPTNLIHGSQLYPTFSQLGSILLSI